MRMVERQKPMGERRKPQLLRAICLSELKPYCLVISLTSQSNDTLQVTILMIGSHHSVTSPTNPCLLATGKPDRGGKKSTLNPSESKFLLQVP